MQAEMKDGTYGPIQKFNQKEMSRWLKDESVETVNVFDYKSPEHKHAKKMWAAMTRKQRRSIKKVLRARSKT